MQIVAECLGCGQTRTVLAGLHRRADAGECPRCRYVGWAASADVDETLRRRLRSRPLERRRLRPA